MPDYPPDSTRNHPDASDFEPDDNGTMPRNAEALADTVIGRRIVHAETTRIRTDDFTPADEDTYTFGSEGLVLTLDDGRRVLLADSHDCCAYTNLEKFLLHPERVDHVITGVATTGGYTHWHIFADLGDVLELDVSWSCGNPFYYGYGFDIAVSTTIEGAVVQHEIEAP